MSFEDKEFKGRRIGSGIPDPQKRREKGAERIGIEIKGGGEKSFQETAGDQGEGEKGDGDRKDPKKKREREWIFRPKKIWRNREGGGSSDRKRKPEGRSFGGGRTNDKKERFSSAGDKGKRKPRWKNE